MWENGQLVSSNIASNDHYNIVANDYYKTRFGSKEAQDLLRNLEAFLKTGITKRQLKFRKNADTVLRFNTWNDAPTIPEFYDLREFRQSVDHKKKKKGGG